MGLSTEEIVQLFIALIIGGIIGIEREVSSKAAGFRTMILISVGSTLFTIMSIKLGSHGSEDRIAANILTGIGFIGAGVVFKNGFNVIGLTTAATIWVTSALGMAVGSKDYMLAVEGAILTIIILYLFEYLQNMLTSYHQHRGYNIIFTDVAKTIEIETKLNALTIKYTRRTETKNNNELRLSVDVYGSKAKIESFNKYLLNEPEIKSFDSWV
ncbi:MAG: MgtC/SapB family protein [Bacteroidia bacterium]|nr:MgtC/SapB family protein [Bacteroidia bacterium]